MFYYLQYVEWTYCIISVIAWGCGRSNCRITVTVIRSSKTCWSLFTTSSTFTTSAASNATSVRASTCYSECMPICHLSTIANWELIWKNLLQAARQQQLERLPRRQAGAIASSSNTAPTSTAPSTAPSVLHSAPDAPSTSAQFLLSR